MLLILFLWRILIQKTSIFRFFPSHMFLKRIRGTVLSRVFFYTTIRLNKLLNKSVILVSPLLVLTPCSVFHVLACRSNFLNKYSHVIMSVFKGFSNSYFKYSMSLEPDGLLVLDVFYLFSVVP